MQGASLTSLIGRLAHSQVWRATSTLARCQVITKLACVRGFTCVTPLARDLDLAPARCYTAGVRWLPVVVFCISSGCVPVYDAQLSDRRAELEQHRSIFLSADERVETVIGARNRVFWIGIETPRNEAVLRSFDPSSDAEPITYDFTRGVTNLESKLQVSDDRVVLCPDFGMRQAFDARAPNLLVGETSEGSGKCAVDGSTVYFMRGDEFQQWTPGGVDPVTEVNLAESNLGMGSIAGFTVDGNRLLVSEGGRLWIINLDNPPEGTWLENDPAPEGLVILSDRGVLYNTAFEGLFFVALPELATESIDNAVEDGGYRLNFNHDDIHLVDDREDNAVLGDQIIYRGEGGIFAYGLDTGKVQDILLDDIQDGFNESLRYFDPVVLESGHLFVRERGNSDNNVYTVLLADVIR